MPHILEHPFITGNHSSCRLVSQKAEYDVFISYKVASDSDVAEALFLKLSELGLKVWWDKKSLELGKDWEKSFIEGLTNSNHFVPILSREAINGRDVWQNFSFLRHDSPCDNVLLEHRMALELQRRGFIDCIYPVLAGDKRDGIYSKYTFKGENACHPSFVSLHENVCVENMDKKVRDYVTNMGMGCPYELKKTVKSILTDITKYQGLFLTGNLDDGISGLASEIRKHVNDLKSEASESVNKEQHIDKLVVVNQKLLEDNKRLKYEHLKDMEKLRHELLQENERLKNEHLNEIGKLRDDFIDMLKENNRLRGEAERSTENKIENA